jgi:hypothetical protein
MMAAKKMDKYIRMSVLGTGSFGSAILVRKVGSREQLVIKEIDVSRMGPKERKAAEQEAQVRYVCHSRCFIQTTSAWCTRQKHPATEERIQFDQSERYSYIHKPVTVRKRKDILVI